MESSPKKNSWWQNLLLIIGLGMLFVMLPLLIYGQYTEESSTDAQVSGTVTSITDTSYRNMRGCDVDFRVGDELYSMSDQCAAATRPGDTLQVYYKADDPSHAVLSSPSDAKTSLFVGLGAVVLMVVVLVVYNRAMKRLEKTRPTSP